MSEVTTSLKLHAPPRIDETKVSKPLQDLFASWREALREPFRGITADGEIEQNLFSKRPGGTVAPIVDAATRFLAALSADERSAVPFRSTARCGVTGATSTAICSDTGCASSSSPSISVSSLMIFSACRLASMRTKRHEKR